jgi:hypothetical protein
MWGRVAPAQGNIRRGSSRRAWSDSNGHAARVNILGMGIDMGICQAALREATFEHESVWS